MKLAHSNGKIAIAGAGVAGLSAAIALKLAGYSVAIFEREQELHEVGAGIQMGPHATRVMEGWHLDLLGSAVEPETLELRNAHTGALLNTIPLKAGARVRYGSPYLTLMRTDLQKALLARANELDIPIRYGAAISRAHDEGSGVAIEAAGASLAAAALIGADGIKSAVRGLAGFHPRLFSAQAVAWRGLLPLSAIPAPMRNAIVLWMAPGAHLVHYPVSGGARINAVLIIDDVFQMDREDQSDVTAYLQRRLSGWAETPLQAIASAPEWLKWRLSGVEKWTGGEGRVQLIGDAWHAMRPYLASGGVMAVEDGAALAASLTESRGDIVEGFKLFRKSRGPRVWRVAEASAQIGRIYNCPQPFDMVRDLVIRLSSGSRLLGRNDWLFGGTGGSAGRES
ncbi:MAG: FAD-dependent monooxygenase [Rhodomicrobium sp.]